MAGTARAHRPRCRSPALLGSVVLLVYAAIVWATVATFVFAYEEPKLAAEFGEQYDAYRRAVRAWWPRLTPWTDQATDGANTNFPAAS